MAYTHISLHLEKMGTPGEKVIQGRKYILNMTGNAHFTAPNPVPNPTLIFYEGKCKALSDGEIASGKGKLSTEDLHIVEDSFDLNTIMLKAYVETVANVPGNTEEQAREIIIGAGFTPTEHGAPITTMGKPDNFSLDFGPDVGGIQAFVRPMHGAKSYVVEISLDGKDFTKFVPRVFPSTKDMILTGLESGTNYHVRLTVIGSHTHSTLSDVIQQRAR